MFRPAKESIADLGTWRRVLRPSGAAGGRGDSPASPSCKDGRGDLNGAPCRGGPLAWRRRRRRGRGADAGVEEEGGGGSWYAMKIAKWGIPEKSNQNAAKFF